MTKKKKLNAMEISNHARAKNTDVDITVVGWCTSFYKKALEKRLLNLGLEVNEVFDYHDELHVEECLGANPKILLLAGFSEFSPQLITTKLFDFAAKIPTCANVVFAGHESLHKTINTLLNNVVCCPPLFSNSYEIVNFEFEKHIVCTTNTVLDVSQDIEKYLNIPLNYQNISSGAVVVAEHSGSCSLLTRGERVIGQWQIQSVIGLNLFVEKFRDVYSSDLKLAKMIAKFELKDFHEIMTTSLLSRSSIRKIEIIYLAFITSLLVDKFKNFGNRDVLKIAFVGSISENFSRDDFENIIEIVFDSDSLVRLNAEIDSKDIMQKMER